MEGGRGGEGTEHQECGMHCELFVSLVQLQPSTGTKSAPPSYCTPTASPPFTDNCSISATSAPCAGTAHWTRHCSAAWKSLFVVMFPMKANVTQCGPGERAAFERLPFKVHWLSNVGVVQPANRMESLNTQWKHSIPRQHQDWSLSSKTLHECSENGTFLNNLCHLVDFVI